MLDKVEEELKKHNLPVLAWYDAQLEIEKVGADGIRPFELEQRLLLPQYGIARLLSRMVKAGLIARDDVDDDGRGQIVRLTQEGLATRSAMWPIYSAVLIRLIEKKLTPEDASELERTLGKLINPWL